MAMSSYPFENQPTTESQYSQLFRQLGEGVQGGFGGVLEVYADSTGMNVKVRSGFAIVRGHAFHSTATETLAIGAASTLKRVDTVVLRLDPSQDKISLVVKAGTPASAPSAPAMTVTDTGIYELPLANVTVEAKSVTVPAGAVADRRIIQGYGVAEWTDAGRPTHSTGFPALGWNRTSKRLESNASGSWAAVIPSMAWGDITGRPSTFAPSAHGHKWSEISDKPSTFPASDHAHSWDSITGKPSSFNPASHSHTWASITSKPSTFAPAAHDHTELDKAGVRLWVNTDTAGARLASNAVHGRVYTSASHSGNRLMLCTTEGTLGVLDSRGKVSGYRIDAYGPTDEAYSYDAGTSRYSVWMDGAGRFGRSVSSRRYKENIEPAEINVDDVLALEPVTYNLKRDPDGERELGLIAEDSTAVPWLVQYDVDRDEDGQPIEGAVERPETVRYEQGLTVALLAVVKSQAARLDALEARLDALEVAA